MPRTAPAGAERARAPMRLWVQGLMTMLAATAAATTTACTAPAGGAVSNFEDPLEAVASEQADERLRIDGAVDSGDGLRVRVSIAVDDDKDAISLDYEGETQILDWDRKDDARCNCRVYVNESFVVTVTFAAGASDARATIKAKTI